MENHIIYLVVFDDGGIHRMKQEPLESYLNQDDVIYIRINLALEKFDFYSTVAKRWVPITPE